MHINDALGRNVDDGLRDDLAVTDHHHDFGMQLFATARRTSGRRIRSGWYTGNPRRSAVCLTGDCRQLASASFRPIGLREHGQNAVACRDDRLPAWARRTIGVPRKTQLHSPAFTNFRTLRRIRSRFSALTWLI